MFYYYCNRVGTYKSEGTGKHQLKTQGTAKIGSQCSAYIKAVQDINTHKIHCYYCPICPTHYNHTVSLFTNTFDNLTDIVKNLKRE